MLLIVSELSDAMLSFIGGLAIVAVFVLSLIVYREERRLRARKAKIFRALGVSSVIKGRDVLL